MAGGRYDTRCAEEQLRAAGIDVTAVNACMGPADADHTHPVLEVAGCPWLAVGARDRAAGCG